MTSDPPRILACLDCGAPVEVPEFGGESACRCGATHAWGPRPGQRSTALPKPERKPGEADPQYEERRVAYLSQRADEGAKSSPYATFDAPPGLEHLELAYDDPTLPGLLTEAFRRAVERCEESHGAMDAERNLFWIAGKAKNVAALTGGDRLRGHAWVQTAREIIHDPGFQHVFACELADYARKDGDLARARALLELADPTPWQLPLDSQYRTSAGMLALASDDVESALELVGERNGKVPFTEACVYQACFMRVAALERAGRPAQAQAAVAFNLEVLPRNIIDDWLDGSTLLAPVLHTLERIELEPEDEPADLRLEAIDDPVDDLEPVAPGPVSITPAKPSPKSDLGTRRSGHRALWIASAVLAVLGVLSVWAYTSL